MTHDTLRRNALNSFGQDCWSCGHYLIGAGCWKNGDMSQPGWLEVSPSDSCEEWVCEGSPGTITGKMAAQRMEWERKLEAQKHLSFASKRFEYSSNIGELLHGGEVDGTAQKA